MVGCRLLPEIHEGYVQDTPLSRLWRSPQASPTIAGNQTSRLGDPCKTCPELSVCRGGCRAFASRRFGEAEGPDLRCPRSCGTIDRPTDRGNQRACGEIIVLGNIVRNAGDRVVPSVVSVLSRAGMRPASCHVCEVLSAAASAAALVLHMRPLALAFFLVHGFFDYLDGALRRSDPSLATDIPALAERKPRAGRQAFRSRNLRWALRSGSTRHGGWPLRQ